MSIKIEGTSHVCALKFKESAGAMVEELSYEYVRRILNELAIYESLVFDPWASSVYYTQPKDAAVLLPLPLLLRP